MEYQNKRCKQTIMFYILFDYNVAHAQFRLVE